MVKVRTMYRPRFTNKTRMLDRVKLNINLLADGAEFAPLMATLIFNSAFGEVTEYTVTVDGKDYRSSFGRAEVLVERNKDIAYTISAEGFASVEGTVMATDVNLDVFLHRLVPNGEQSVCPCPCNEYTITISASPAGAMINLGNKFEGTDSVSGKFLKGTSVAYEVSLDGYASQSGTIVVSGDQTINVELVKSASVDNAGASNTFTEDVVVDGGLDLSAATKPTALISDQTNITVGGDVTSNYLLSMSSKGGNMAIKGTESKPVVISGNQPQANGNASISINTGGSVEIANVEFAKDVAYNAVEIGISPTNGSPKSILIENMDFTKSLLNNAILIHSTQDNAEVIIRNVHFGKVSNAVRFSNMTNATGVKVLFENCTVDEWESGEYAGFLLMQDFTSKDAAEAQSANRFGPDKFEITFKGCTGPNGAIMFANPADGAQPLAGSDQTYYEYYNKGFGTAENIQPDWDSASWPTFKFE